MSDVKRIQSVSASCWDTYVKYRISHEDKEVLAAYKSEICRAIECAYIIGNGDVQDKIKEALGFLR